MNFDIIITGNTIGALFTKYLILGRYKAKVANIIPPVSILKNAYILMFSATFRNLKIQFRSLLNSSSFKSYKRFSVKFTNKSFDIELDKNVFFVSNLESLKQYIGSIIFDNSHQKIFNNSIKDIYWDNSKWFVKLDNNKVITSQYLLLCDDFWGLTWNFLDISLKHNGGWIVKSPNLEKVLEPSELTGSDKIIFSFGDVKKSVILGSSDFIFANYIDREYSIDNIINRFLLSNFDIFKNYKIISWDKYVLPFSYKPNENKKKIILKLILSYLLQNYL